MQDDLADERSFKIDAEGELVFAPEIEADIFQEPQIGRSCGRFGVPVVPPIAVELVVLCQAGEGGGVFVGDAFEDEADELLSSYIPRADTLAAGIAAAIREEA